MKNKNIKKILSLLFWGVFLVLFAACASAPGAGGEARPAWVDSPPADTSESVFFLGVGSDPAGSEASARQLASSQLVSDITKFLGVKVTSETSVEAKDAFGQFESNVSQTINEQSSAMIGDLRIKDVYTENNASGTNVFLLAEYDKAALLKEKARIEAVFAEQQEAISGPEKEGQALMTSGEYSLAAMKFMEAALAAVSSSVDNAEIKFERNINNAKEAVSNIRFTGLNDNIEGFLGQPLDAPFELEVTAAGDSSQGLVGVPVRVYYKVAGRNNRKRSVTESFLTDSDGMVVFELPAPEFTGRENLIMSLDFSAPLEPLQRLNAKFLDQVDGLEQVIGQKNVSFTYEVVSRAREVATAVFVTDLDRGRNPMGRTDTTSGILEILSGEGFKVAGLPQDASMASLSDAAFRNAVLTAYGNTYERVIFGTSEIASFEESSGAYLVQVSGTVNAIDLNTGNVLYSSNKTSRARGQSETGIISQAFKSLGKLLAEDLANNLP